MDNITLTRDELKDIIHESVHETLTEILSNQDKRSEFLEMIEDFEFGRMMEEAENDESVSEELVMDKLKRISSGKI